MREVIQALSLLTIIIPILGWVIISSWYRRGVKLASYALAFSIATLLTSSINIPIFFLNSSPRIIFSPLSFRGIGIFSFILDGVSITISFLVAFIGFLILLFSQGYMTPRNREHRIDRGFSWFYGLMLLFMASMIGVIYSYSLISMTIFYELTSICSWALIGFFHEDPKSRYASKKALYITHLGWFFLIAASALIYSSTGKITLDALQELNPALRGIAVILIAIACWSKSAQVPFFTWLPDAMVAPTPVSAYLHAAAMVKVGAYLLFRTIQYSIPLDFNISFIIGLMAIITMIYGLLMYVPQLDMKRLLAYSTITQISYMFLALSFASLGEVNGLRASIFHLWNHAYAKALFFLIAGALAYSTGSRFMSDYSGIISRSKTISLGFAVAAFSIVGVPPLNCFYSKFLIFLSGFSAGNIFAGILTLIAIGESVCSFIVFLYWFTRCVYGDPSDMVEKAQEIPKSILSSLMILIAMCMVSAYLFYPILGGVNFWRG